MLEVCLDWSDETCYKRETIETASSLRFQVKRSQDEGHCCPCTLGDPVLPGIRR